MDMWKQETDLDNLAGKWQRLCEVYKTLSVKSLVISRALLQDVFEAPKAEKSKGSFPQSP